MVFAGLGEAVAAPQIAVTVLSALTWQFIVLPCAPTLATLILDAQVWEKCTDKQREQIGVAITSSVFAVFVTLVAAGLLLWEPAAVSADPLYGHSQVTQVLMASASGFFAWNLVVDFRKQFSWPNMLHHSGCLSVYFLLQYPFSPRFMTTCLLWEASTPPLCIFTVLKVVGLDKGAFYVKARAVFSGIFVAVRICYGLPVTIFWGQGVLELMSARGGRAPHSVLFMYYCLALALLLNGLNVYWFVLIVRGFVVYFSKKKADGRQVTHSTGNDD